MAPTTWPGKIIAGMLCVISVLFMAMPISAPLLQVSIEHWKSSNGLQPKSDGLQPSREGRWAKK